LADEGVLQAVIDAFSDAEVDAVYGDLVYIDRINTSGIVRQWRAGEFSRRKMYNGWMPPHPTFFVRREYFEKYGLYRLDLGTAADYELMLRFLLVHKVRVKYIPRVLVNMRAGGASNVSLRARWDANRMDRKAWQVNGLKPYPWTLWAKPMRKLGQWWVR
jgi:glycosyltransferase